MSSRALASLLLAAAFLGGCSASEAAPTPATGAPAGAEAPAEDETCGDAPATVKKHLDSDDVDTVVVVGQCTSLEVHTRLAEEDVATARKLCDRAGEVAYVGDINGVTVLSESGEELSVGITGAHCLP